MHKIEVWVTIDGNTHRVRHEDIQQVHLLPDHERTEKDVLLTADVGAGLIYKGLYERAEPAFDLPQDGSILVGTTVVGDAVLAPGIPAERADEEK